MRMPRKGIGPLHLDHLSIWIFNDKSPELSQLRDTRWDGLDQRVLVCQKGLKALVQLVVVKFRVRQRGSFRDKINDKEELAVATMPAV